MDPGWIRGGSGVRRSCLGFAVGGEVALDEEGPESHAEVLVGLIETQPGEFGLSLGAVDLARELVDGAAERRGEMLAESRHDPPQHVVMQNPVWETPRNRNAVGLAVVVVYLRPND